MQWCPLQAAFGPDEGHVWPCCRGSRWCHRGVWQCTDGRRPFLWPLPLVPPCWEVSSAMVQLYCKACSVCTSQPKSQTCTVPHNPVFFSTGQKPWISCETEMCRTPRNFEKHFHQTLAPLLMHRVSYLTCVEVLLWEDFFMEPWIII